MSFQQKLRHELDALVVATLYFGLWLVLLTILKELVLAEYHIKVRGFSLALIGALLLAKVVLILEHVPLGGWIQHKPRAFDVLVRTLLYGCGVFVMLLVEKAFETRREYGGFGRALFGVWQHRDMPHVWANAICLSFALLGFNVFSVVRRHLGEHGLTRLFLSPANKKTLSAPGGIETMGGNEQHPSTTSKL
jgi:hypothetical protein